ncbi:MAG: DNA primase [Paludibacter sp.]|jgi:DNA primase|nr:DNA primase [Paludibacter sp.]
MLDQTTIDRIQDAARIQDVVSEYVTLRKRGVNLLGMCPFHNEKTPSFTVSPAKGIYKCFGCGKGGNSVHFIMEIEQLQYYDALKFLAKKYNIEFEERELTDEEKAMRNTRESMLLVNEFAQKYFSDILHNHPEGKSLGLSYFRERGFRDDIIQKFQLGYSLDAWDDFAKNAIEKGYKKEFLLKTGLCFENDKGGITDRFRARVMFPVHTLSGKVVAFGGRVMKKDEKTAKYVNSPESEIYHKSNELYGIYFAKQAIVKQDRCFLVEGYTDVISMHQSGIENVVASSGTSLTVGQIRLIHRFTDNVTVIYDGDAAGIKASIRGIDMLLEDGLNIKVLLLPDGEDPDSFAQKTNAADFINFVEQNSADFIRFKTRLLLNDAGGDPIKRAALVQDIVRSIAIIPNATIRAEYVKECATLLNADEAMLYHEINKLKRQEKAEQAKAGVGRATGEGRAEYESGNDEYRGKEFEQIFLYDKEEKNILQLLFRFGKNVVYENENVAQYIRTELENYKLNFENTVYQRFYNEYLLNNEQENFDAKRYFLYHEDKDISQLAAEFLTEKYTLSKVHERIKKLPTDEDRLPELTFRLVHELLNNRKINRVRSLLVEMKNAVEQRDDARSAEIMHEISIIESGIKDLAKRLGERIIIKI